MIPELRKHINSITVWNVSFNRLRASVQNKIKFYVCVEWETIGSIEACDVTLLSYWRNFTPTLVQHEGLFYHITLEEHFVVATLV